MSSDEELSDNETSFQDDEGDDEEITSEEDEEPNEVRHFSSTTSTRNKDVESGEAIRTQLKIWDGLLETRIKLQKPLSSCNVLPHDDKFAGFMDSVSQETITCVEDTREDLRVLLQELVGLQDIFLKNNPVLSKNSALDDDNEEIDSDDEVEKDADEEPLNEVADHNFSLSELEDILEKRYRKLEPFRNSTLETWNSKTHQVTVGLKKNFAAFDQSPVKQISQIMADKQRLLQRTQTARSCYHILGSANDVSEKNAPEKMTNSKTTELNSEIFDDDDFYHVLLRELIERKTGDVSDPIELSRQQIQLSQLRKSTKKVVDSKATRDRKIKLDPHPKLISYMAPQQTCSITEQGRNDIYKSLFGKLQRGHVTDDQVTLGLGGIRLIK